MPMDALRSFSVSLWRPSNTSWRRSEKKKNS